MGSECQSKSDCEDIAGFCEEGDQILKSIEVSFVHLILCIPLN
jgi:hypothetical protein